MVPAAGPQGATTLFQLEDESSDEDLIKFVPILNLMEELHLFCQDSTPRDITHMTARMLALQAEIKEKEAFCKTLIRRTERLTGINLETTCKKIGELRLFLHFGHLSLLKFNAFLDDAYRDAIWQKNRENNARRSSQDPPPK